MARESARLFVRRLCRGPGANIIRTFAAEDANIIYGGVYDDALADNLPGPVDYQQLDAVPAVIRRNRASTVEALQQSGVDKYDIPAFLRKQAD